MRAKLPDQEGFVERDGVKLHYEIYGDGPETIVFLPPWSIVHSRVYKAQLPYFSERFRCIAFDGRGNGKSDRPEDVAAYSLDNYVADALAVMDATDAGKAIVVGLSFGGMLACILAAHHPDRVKAAILAGTAASIGPSYPYMTPEHFRAKRERFEGWDKYNRAYWLVELSRFCRALRPQHLLRTALDQADRGWCRLGGRYHRPGAGQDRGGAHDPAGVRCQRSDVSQDTLSRADDPRRGRPHPALCPRATGGRGSSAPSW